jgi:uncharacterized protein YgbK (DUF1537 family)
MISPNEIAVIADDLTGACDTAACFAAALGSVAVHMFCDRQAADDQILHVINTQSRLLPPRTSQALLQRLGSNLARKRIIFKKIDTALRGPIGAELQGLIAGTGPRKVVVAPALPRIGRTTRAGIQYDRDQPIHQSVAVHDPHTKPPSADIAHVIAQTGHLPFLVADAETDADLQAIVAQHLAGPPVVFVGSLGLADALVQQIPRTPQNTIAPQPARAPLIVCGSQFPNAIDQIKHAAHHAGVRALPVPAAGRLAHDAFSPTPGKPTLLYIEPPANSRIHPDPTEILPSFVAAAMRIYDQFNPDGLGIIGGETAFELLKRLGATQLAVQSRQEEVISCGMMLDGRARNLPLATKGGSVGREAAVVTMLNYLQNPKGASV